MKTAPSFADHCLDVFSGLGPVVARAMFGGYGFYLGRAMFAIGDAEEWRIWLKVDEHTHVRFERTGGEPFIYSSKGWPDDHPLLRHTSRLRDGGRRRDARLGPARAGGRRAGPREAERETRRFAETGGRVGREEASHRSSVRRKETLALGRGSSSCGQRLQGPLGCAAHLADSSQSTEWWRFWVA